MAITQRLSADDDDDEHELVPRAASAPPAVLKPGAVTPVSGSQVAEEVGLKVPEGFSVTRYADDSLAHDIFSMTIDSRGRVVVSGPGYVKILEDRDGDGKADHAIDFADGPKTGAQGLYFYGRNLLCTGDEGLLHYKDEDKNDRADGDPEVLLKIAAGGEHHAHAVRRGPDGWWYLIAGNFAEVTKSYVTEGASPVKTPHAGVIMRLKPDASGAEIFADCFRNAYDFDFDSRGELFTYDSDGEQDISLPWYMPTRVFHVVPGGEHGWISENCKRPDNLLDSAPVVAATGRSSPSGVVCYRHVQFPESYRDGLFVLDWTYGRILFVPLARQGATYARQEAVEFATATGHLGFAPTDVEIGRDGSLFVCVGGRGTQGTVYRIQYTGADKGAKPALFTVKENSSSEQLLLACLTAPAPQSSWSRAKWVPLATKLGAEAFLKVALDEHQAAASRIRAIEILTDLFDGLPGTAAEILSMVKSADLRARAVWSLGARPPKGLTGAVLSRYLGDEDPLVRRRALETAARFRGAAATLVPAIANCLNDDDRLVRMAAIRTLPGMKPEIFKQLADESRKLGWRSTLTATIGYIWRSQANGEAYNSYAVDLGRRILEGKHSNELKFEATRVLQLALGDVGNESAGPLFESYAPVAELESHERELDPLRITLAKVFPTGDSALDYELARVIAMVAPANDELLAKLISRIEAESSPVDDLHYLIAAARMPATLGAEDRGKLATAFLSLEEKLKGRGFRKDANWNARVGALYGELVGRDPQLPDAIISDPRFGEPGHVTLMAKLNYEQYAQGIAAFVKRVKENPEYPWNNDVVFVIGAGKKPEHYELVRQQFDKLDVRMAVLMVLGQDPDEQDRDRFAAGLESEPIEVVTACVTALEKLAAKEDAVELTSLVKLLRRLGDQKAEYALRERVIKLLERNSDEEVGFVFGPAGYKPQPETIRKWSEWVVAEYPEEAAKQFGGNEADLPALLKRLADISWNAGDSEKGRKLFTARGCAQCHSGGSGLGPDLAGVTGRFSREDLFIAVAFPNRDVSPRYQTTIIETKSGQIFTGLPVFNSTDIRVLRNSVNQTFSIMAGDIESERKSSKSLMPEGLMKDLHDSDLADLYAYLKTLSMKTAQLDSPTAKGGTAADEENGE